MDENTTKIIKERFDSLPESIQETILSTDYEKTLIEIGKQYQFNVEQEGILERETTLVMMGLTPTKIFETELIRELNIDKTKGSQIVKDINERIFLKVEELLKLMNTPAREKPSTRVKPKWEQTIDFILSGGNYAAFIEPTNSPLPEYPKGEKEETVLPVFSIKKENEKENFNI